MSHAAVAHVRSDLNLLGEGNSFQETICEMLGNSNFFSDLDHNEIKMLAKWVKAYSVSAGSIIFQEGNKDACLCVLAKGEIAILKETAPNESKKIAKIKPGRTIGEMSVVDGYPFSASAVASKNSVILLITQTNFNNLIEQNGKLGVKLLLKIAKIISLRLRQTTGQLNECAKLAYTNEQSSFLRKQESSRIMYRLKGGLFSLDTGASPV